MFRHLVALTLAVLLLATPLLSGAAGENSPQSPINPKAATEQKYPKIVLFSVSWCPHCKAAKEYFTKNNIPFINRDVEIDSEALTELTGKYKSQGVPVIVIGNDDKVLKGFDQAKFEKAMQEVQRKGH
ncbi:MAG TPA: glutaredoxin domain-containing protein [Geobacteraceae bacterium]